MSTLANEIFTKQPSEEIIYGMDFTAWLGDGITITSAGIGVSTSCGEDADLFISDTTIIDGVVNFKIAGGTHGVKYKITVTVTTSDDQILEGDGILNVKET